MLKPDDLCVGQFLTVHHGHRPHCACGCGGQGPETYAALKGLPLAVAAIQLPYIATTFASKEGLTIILDIRECELMKLDDQYVNAVVQRGIGQVREVSDGS